MADEPILYGTRRTPSEQDLFDQYMLSFISIREYLEGLDRLAATRNQKRGAEEQLAAAPTKHDE